MARLSVITLTLNEERNIGDCLESVAWADERIVLDSGSTDRTLEIARRHTPDIHSIDWPGYGAARNIGITKATGAWILWLDADERVTPELAEELQRIIGRDDGRYAGYLIARRAYFLGRWIKHCGWYPSRVVRLFRKERGRFSETRVHERLLVEGPVGETTADILHYTDPHLHHYLTKFNKYTSLAAEDLFDSGRPFRLSDMTLRPLFQFFKMYVMRLGFLDGIEGFMLCLLSSAYVLVKYAKLWELEYRKNK